FEQDGQFWFNGYNGSPETRTPISSDSTVYSFADVPGEGRVIRFTRGSSASWVDVGQIGVVKPAAGRRSRATVRWRRIAGSGDMRVWIFGFNDAYSVNYTGISSAPTGSNDTWYEHSFELSGDTVIAAGSTWLRAGARGQDGNSEYEVSSIRFEDVTESYRAGLSAQAAFESEQSAAVHEDGAGASAAAAQSDRVQAE